MTSEPLDAETRAYLLDARRLKRFLERLRNHRRRTVCLEALWSALAAVCDDLPSGTERRKWLLAVLEELAERRDIVLPVQHGKQWDRTSEIALPTAVSVAASQSGDDPGTPWRQFPWHPRLQWIFRLRSLSPDHFAFLQRVNKGLVEGWFEQPECFKYRSLQLTGDEKRLTVLASGSLFAQGCLTLEMLGCLPEALPLGTEYLSAEPSMLVFENAAPFVLARSIAAGSAQPRFGRLAWGAGTQVLKAVTYLPMIRPAVTEIFYVGDLDAAGLRIAADLQRTSTSIPVRPATRFHQAMLESASRLGAEDGWAAKDEQGHLSDAAVRFLASGLQPKVAGMIRHGRRIPEESLSHATMASLLID
jgi:hypothetical protein